MIDQVKEKCELFTKNYNAVHKKFFLEAKLMSVVSGLVFTSADKEVDVNKMAECRKLLEKKTSILSNFRSVTELLLVSKMALSENPEQYITDIMAVYKKICKGKFLENAYMVLAAILICDFGRQDDVAELVEKSNEIMKKMNSDHPMLTDSEDTSFAMFLALSYKDSDTIINDIKESYDYLKKTCKVKASSNGIQGLSEILAITYGDMKEKCDKVIRIYNEFTDRKAEYGSENEIVALGSLIDIDLDPDSLVNEIMETEKYLKDKSGFGNSSMDKKNRLMYAAFIVADACGGNSDIISNSVINNTISVIIAKRISIMISIITNAVSALASAKSSSEEKEENKETTGN